MSGVTKRRFVNFIYLGRGRTRLKMSSSFLYVFLGEGS